MYHLRSPGDCPLLTFNPRVGAPQSPGWSTWHVPRLPRLPRLRVSPETRPAGSALSAGSAPNPGARMDAAWEAERHFRPRKYPRQQKLQQDVVVLVLSFCSLRLQFSFFPGGVVFFYFPGGKCVCSKSRGSVLWAVGCGLFYSLRATKKSSALAHADLT